MNNKTVTDQIRIEKYRGTRYWVGDQLLAVTVYKKGATAVKEMLLKRSS